MHEEAHPTVVLLHAAGLDNRMWHEVAQGLGARGHDVLAPDVAGHGGRPVRPADFTLVDLADDIVERLRPLGARPVVLVGVSLGGMLAQLAGLRMGRQVAGLVLANTMAETPPGLRDALHERAERTERLGMAGMIDETLDRWFEPRVQRSAPGLMETVRRWLGEADAQVNAQTWRAIADLAVLPELPRLTAPALVLSGAADRASPARLSQTMHAALRRSRHVEIPGAGHLTPLEVPDLFVSQVDAFLRADVAQGEPEEGRP